MFKIFKETIPISQSNEKLFKDGELLRLDKLLKEQIKKKFSSKLHLYIVDSGSCSGCELELQTLFNPLYNVSKLGLEVVYDIKKADILIVTGLVTGNMYSEILKLHKDLKNPKRVILFGDCPLFKAPFHDTFALKRPLDTQFSSAYHIVGCPPEPKIILTGLLKYLQKV